MQKDVAFKLAASSILIGLTMVGCKPMAGMYRPAAISSKAPSAQAQAAAVYAKVEDTARQQDYVKALPLAEQAVELSPQDVLYRMVLADLYVKNGRFLAAEATYGDVLALNPSNSRAALSRALAQIAQGKKLQALVTLDHIAANAAPADVGLAYALAGETRRGLDLLEPAARADHATGRVRQNLALTYALAGDWQKARVTAAQDMSPADLGARMEQWAAFAQPTTSYDQVASLLGVHPAADPGQPAQLALAQTAPEPVAVAAAAPVEAVEPAPVQAPTRAFVEAPAPAEVAPAPVSAVEVKYAAAAETLVKPQPTVIPAAAQPYKTPVPAFVPARQKTTPAVRKAAAAYQPVAGRFVVQLGAYSKEASIDRAWKQAQLSYGFDGDDRALTTTINMPGKGLLHRLSVAGLDSRADAVRLCSSIRAKGGNCFVRETAGDAPVQWASLRQRTRRA